jgi:hypothetical protein
VLEGPDAGSLLIAGLRGHKVWRYGVVRLPKGAP